jgi:hypothetical protein
LLPESFLIGANESTVIEEDAVQSERDHFQWATGSPSTSTNSAFPDFVGPGRSHITVIAHLLAIAAQVAF